MTAQAQFADTEPQMLDGAEISNLLRTMQAAQFNKSSMIAEKDDSFKPRSLVEIAQEAEQKRREEQAKAAAEHAAAEAQRRAEEEVQRQAELEQQNREAAGAPQPENGVDAHSAPQPDMPNDGAISPIEEGEAALSSAAEQPIAEPAAPLPTITEQELAQKLMEAETALKAAFEAEKTALVAELTETHYHRGFEAGMTAAKTAEPTEEEKAHIAHQEAERQDILSRFEAIISSASQMDAIDSRALAEEMETALLRLAEERAQVAITENPEGLVQKIRQMADNVATQASVMDVHLNASDKQAIEKWMAGSALKTSWHIHADAEMRSGDVRIVIGGIELSDIFASMPEPHPAKAEAERQSEQADEDPLAEAKEPLEAEAEMRTQPRDDEKLNADLSANETLPVPSEEQDEAKLNMQTEMASEAETQPHSAEQETETAPANPTDQSEGE